MAQIILGKTGLKIEKNGFGALPIQRASFDETKEIKKNAKNGLDKMKYEVAREIGVDLKVGYNGDLTSKQAGSVGGYMVKKLIEKGEQSL